MIQIQTTTEYIESKGGMILAGKIAKKAGLARIRSTALKASGAIITSMFGLMAEGKNDFENMEEKRGSLFFKIYEKDPILPVFLWLNAALDCP